MKVFVTGATGVLGRRLVRQLVARGHTAVGLVRNEQGAQLMQSLGAESYMGDLFDAGVLNRAASGAEAIIHAATAIPTNPKATAQDWAMNDRIRREGTQALTDCAAKVGARIYLQQSIVWVARPPDGSFFDEAAPTYPDAITGSALDGERIAQGAGARAGFTVAVLRCGQFYAPDAGHTRMMAQNLMKGSLPLVGGGNAIWSCLHADDAAGAFVTAAEGNRTGLWHVVDNHPVTVRELLCHFAEALEAKAPRPVPVWLARFIAGPRAVKFMTSSTHTSNERFCRDFNWQPRFPTYQEGLSEVIATWKAEGGIP